MDAPLLIVRLAQSKAEQQKLQHFLRVDEGLGSEGQISFVMLRQGLQKIGVHLNGLQEQMDEVFAALDPDGSGTIGFSDLLTELRRVRKLVTPVAPSRPLASCRLPRGGSAPVTRQRAPGGLTHEDGSAYSARELEQAAAGFRRQGELGQALRALEGALAIHNRMLGQQSEVAVDCSRQVADVCNSLGMQMLQRDDFVGCHALLKRAQARGQGDRAMYAITLNNLACYHRRRGHLKVALAHLCKAVEIESHCEAHKPADTHLNLCAVQSELGNHHEAMHHAKRALRLLREELGLPIPVSPYTRDRPSSAPVMSAAGMLTGRAGSHGRAVDAIAPQPPTGPRPPSTERMAVLAIAHHNLAVEQEALRLPDEASRSFAEAASIASHQLGPEHPVAMALRTTHEANLQQRDKRVRAEQLIFSGFTRAQSVGTSKVERAAAELRRQQSMQRHIEQVRFLRENPGKTFKREPLVKRERDTSPKVLAGLSEGDDVAWALREWLKSNANKVMSLFTAWDEDGDGEVDKREFKRAMKALGLLAPARQVDALFDEFDHDGGGRIEFKELNRCLRQGSKVGAITKVVDPPPPPKAMKPKQRPRSAASGMRTSDNGRGNAGATPAGGDVPLMRRDCYEPPAVDDVANEQQEEAFEVGMRQNAMEYDAADVNHDTKLDFAEFSTMIREREAGGHTEDELRARFDSIDENKNDRIDLDEFIRFSLRDALARSSARVIDLFREWDEDDSGSVDLKEFRKAIKALGFDAPKVRRRPPMA